MSESVKKGQFVTKIFFSDNNIKWSSENLWKMISADVKANQQEINKDLVTISYKSL